MKIFNDKEALSWCKEWPLHFEFDDDRLLCAPKNGHTLRVDISGLRWRDLVSVATALACLGAHSVEQFSGGFLWVRRTGIMSPDWEAVMLRTFERFRNGLGGIQSLEAAGAQLFRRDELPECAGALLLVLIAQWDAYFVHPSGDWIAFIDNDDQITVTAKTVEMGADIRKSLELWGETTALLVPPHLF